MPKFRKKPVVIEAFQITRETRQDNSRWPHWLNEAWNRGTSEINSVYPEAYGDNDSKLVIRTVNGPVTVQWGEWIIQGVNGELYPCAADVFAKTYEPAEDAHD